MEEITTYFFDSYALFEVIYQNENYKNYLENINIITTKLNLMELHYGLLQKYGADIANEYYNNFLEFTIPFDDETIMLSNLFKVSMKKKRLSYIDCLGYTLAKLRGIKFLTGDKEFKDLENVEFVK